MKLAEKLAVIYSLFRVSLCSGSFSLTVPQSIEAVRGLCVLVSCTFTIDDKCNEDLKNNSKGIWFKDDTQEEHRVYDSTSSENKIKGEITGDLSKKNCTTIFNNISESDSGTYYFRIEAGELNYTYRENSVSINVRDGKLTLSLYRDQKEVEDQKVLEGSSVSLLCSALSPCPTELPTLTWSPLLTNISQEQNQNTSFISSQLNFITTHLHHGLTVTCTATYQQNKELKSTQHSLVLHILYPPKNTSLSVSPSGPVMLGSLVTLSCSSDGNPAVNYTWYRENGEQIETGPTLTINETDTTHSGLYCRAQNQHGAENSPVQLDIQYPPKNTSVSVSPSGPVMLGSLVTLSCSSDGNPAVKYTWYRENGDQIETGPTLTINETDSTHSGLYCRAQNQHGAENSSVQLDIQYPPKNTSLSVSPSGPVMLGSLVTLSCSSDGNPAVNYTWYRENGEQIETGPTLTINETDSTHSGLYCRAQNQHGAENSPVQLDIQYAPQISLHCNSSSEGEIVCVCEVHGRPVPKLEWRRSGQPVPPSEDPSIREESVGHMGLRSFLSMRHSPTDTPTLQCVSTNKLGCTSQLFYSVSTGHCSSTGNFHILSMLVGAAAGASTVMILCAIYLCRRRAHHKPSQEDTAGLVLNDRAGCQEEEEKEDEEGESLYANKNMLSPKRLLEHVMNNPNSLHYSTIYFPNGEEVCGEIRGLSSLTSEYATVQYSSREDPESETTDVGNSAATEEQTNLDTVNEEEIEQPTKEEETYGNIVRHKTSHSDLDAGVEIERLETKPTDPEQLAEAEAAEVKHQKPEHRVSKECEAFCG